MQPEDLSIDCEPITHTFLDDGQNTIDSWSIMHSFGFEAFNLLGKSRGVIVLHACIERLL